MPLKVLTIDDNPGMTELLGFMLRGFGLDVTSANNSELALQMVRMEKPDIITLDLMMPDINGWELCKMIRAFSRTPIIILSALDDPDSAARAREAGADDYLVKPVSVNTLMACINKFTGNAQVQEK